MDNKSDKLIVHWWKDGNVNDVISTIGYLVNLNAKEIQLAINKGIEEDIYLWIGSSNMANLLVIKSHQ